MPSKTSTFERWHFSAAILLPVVLALGITAAATFGFVLWSTASIDQRSFERQTNMIHEVMDARLGCNTLQGFLFSGGVPGEQITAIFADKANAPEGASTEAVPA